MGPRPAAIARGTAAVAITLIGCGGNVNWLGYTPVPSVSAATVSDDELCRLGDELLGLRMLDDALERFIQAGEGCEGVDEKVREAGAGIAASRRLVAQAERLLDEDPTAARRSYLAALTINAGSDEALNGLRTSALDSPTVDPFAPAIELHNAGFEEEAQEQAVEAMKEGGRFSTLPLATQRILDNDPGGIDRWRDSLSDRWNDVLFVAAALILVGVPVLWFTQRRVRKGAWLSRNRFARKWLGARLQFAAGAGAGVEAVSAQMRHLLRRVSTGEDATDITVNTASDEQMDVPDLGTLDPRLQPVVATVRLIFRPDIIRVTPTWASDEDAKRKRITVELSQARRASVPGSASYFAPSASTTAELAGRAAGWVLFELARIRPKAVPDLDVKAGTRIASSYSALLGGIEALSVGDSVSARNAFSEAVDADPENLIALQNLAATEVNHPTPTIMAVGIMRLEGLLR